MNGRYWNENEGHNPMPSIVDLLNQFPVIASLCEQDKVDDLILSHVKIAVIMCGNLKDIPEIVNNCQSRRIHSFIYIDLIDGLSSRDGAVDFVRYFTTADGIVTTKSNQVRRAHALDLACIQRYFVFDAISQANIKKQLDSSAADAVEILPGVIPGVTKYMAKGLNKPLIVGGFVNRKKDVESAIACGATAISTSLPELWYL